MTQTKSKLVATGASTTGDAEAIRHFQEGIASGKHWYLALLGAIGLWSSASETCGERAYIYLIDGEAFDWLLLAERLCGAVDGLLPEAEKNALLFQGLSPIDLSAAEVKRLIGGIKYRQYLNYFYGVIAEEALALAVQEEIDKERHATVLRQKAEAAEGNYHRIYSAGREELLERFRKEKCYPRLKSTSLTELKEFTYWLFKYRLRSSEKARIASDTKKALTYLKRTWEKKGMWGALATDIIPPFPSC